MTNCRGAGHWCPLKSHPIRHGTCVYLSVFVFSFFSFFFFLVCVSHCAQFFHRKAYPWRFFKEGFKEDFFNSFLYKMFIFNKIHNFYTMCS